MVLIDTSCWTHALRSKGDPVIRARFQSLLLASEAAWCDVVRLELWNGVRNDWDTKLMDAMESRVESLAITPVVWTEAIRVGRLARSSGLNIPATDLIIFSCARVHGVQLEHADRHYDLLDAIPGI